MIYAKSLIGLSYFAGPGSLVGRQRLPKGSIIRAERKTERRTIDYLGNLRVIHELHELFTLDGRKIIHPTLILGQELRPLSPLEELARCAE